MIPDVAGQSAAILAAAEPHEFHGRPAKRPVHHIDVVDVLLDDLVAAQPVPVIPVPALPLEIAHVRQPRRLGIVLFPKPDALAVPVALATHQLTELAAMDALHDFDIARLMTPLGAGDDGEFLLLRELRGRNHRATADRIDRHRLFHEHVFAGRDCRLEMRGPKTWRRRENHQVDVRREQLLVSVETREALGRGELELFLRALHLGRKKIGQGHDFHSARRIEAVLRRARATAAAADETHPDAIGSGGRGHDFVRAQARQRSGPGGDGRQLDEIPTREVGAGRSFHRYSYGLRTA